MSNLKTAGSRVLVADHLATIPTQGRHLDNGITTKYELQNAAKSISQRGTVKNINQPTQTILTMVAIIL